MYRDDVRATAARGPYIRPSESAQVYAVPILKDVDGLRKILKEIRGDLKDFNIF